MQVDIFCVYSMCLLSLRGPLKASQYWFFVACASNCKSLVCFFVWPCCAAYFLCNVCQCPLCEVCLIPIRRQRCQIWSASPSHTKEVTPPHSVAPLTFMLFGLCCSYYLTAPISSSVILKRPLWSSLLMYWDCALFKSKRWSEHDTLCGRAGLEELPGSLSQWLLCFQTHSSDAALPLWDVWLNDCRILTK